MNPKGNIESHAGLEYTVFQVFELINFENHLSCHTVSKYNILDISHLIYKIRMLS